MTTARPTIRNSELDALATAFAEMAQWAPEVVAGLSEEQLQWRPQPKRWSMAECIDHLNKTADIYTPALQRGIEMGQQTRGDAPIRHGILGKLFLQAVSPETKWRVATLKQFRPPEKPPMGAVMTRFLAAQEDFIDCVQRADGLDLTKIKVRSPALKFLRLPLGTWLCVMRDHQLRHLNQAAQLRKRVDFPR
ncbi:MAG: DinB family protein [Planctomycetota bacterium]